MTPAQLLKLINIGRAKLGWDDDVYRPTLLRFGGRPDAEGRVSLKSLSFQQQQDLLEYMRKQGFKPAVPGRPNNTDAARRTQLKKIEALLTDAGKPWAYADSIMKRVTKGRKRKMEFCSADDLSAIVGALEATALNRLHRELGDQLQREGWSWADAGIAVQLLFGFSARRDLSRYAETMSQLLRWLRGDPAVTPASAWPPRR